MKNKFCTKDDYSEIRDNPSIISQDDAPESRDEIIRSLENVVLQREKDVERLELILKQNEIELRAAKKRFEESKSLLQKMRDKRKNENNINEHLSPSTHCFEKHFQPLSKPTLHMPNVTTSQTKQEKTMKDAPHPAASFLISNINTEAVVSNNIQVEKKNFQDKFSSSTLDTSFKSETIQTENIPTNGKRAFSSSKSEKHAVKCTPREDNPAKKKTTVSQPPLKKMKSENLIPDFFQKIKSSNFSESKKLLYPTFINSKHTRKLKNILIDPSNMDRFFTSSLDGMVRLWELKGKSAVSNSQFDCLIGNKRWPEDLALEASGKFLITVYNGDGNDEKIGMVDMQSKMRKPSYFNTPNIHSKGINTVNFLPWQKPTQFATGGGDHAVALWTINEENKIKGKLLHKRHHTSAVMSVASLTHKNIIMSAGLDKRVFGTDVVSERLTFQIVMEAKALSILPNPVDPNLLLVQIGLLGQQLRLLDYRAPTTQLHCLGWQQESSESQTSLIGSCWSPDGYLISVGSTDPKIHIFDIRYTGTKPAFTCEAHTKRVFKALWHPTMPTVLSISSDLNIGLHTVR